MAISSSLPTASRMPALQLSFTADYRARATDEPRNLSQSSSPNVLFTYFDARNVSSEWAYFVTPRCTGGDLDDFISSRPSVHAATDVAALGEFAQVQAQSMRAGCCIKISAGQYSHGCRDPANSGFRQCQSVSSG